ncbi:heat-shock protein Hsp90 [Methanomicrobium antiquum]|uniref:Heat-shock protein Hsp90 n=1 Tax=Methanomicrobium antiquum TaxID=487686 RepID=A0AAF0JLW9_9EURY|nr:heat-shock protein Hsp90 [Methanomicrobium antiquum]MDD3977771.1 heat-shock protein Hsp90 [Methanomicrobium sp.]WFN37164.1 heat-shock protein Hsp90 [Methanomicrobium antiquum]
MANEPNDDVFKNLAKVMEDIISSLPLDENARFVGCTIISGHGEEPRIFQMDGQSGNEDDLEYEVMEGPEKVYVTVELPSDVITKPYIDIQPEFVRICFDESENSIRLPCMVQAGQSVSNIKNGILDIICDKLEISEAAE